MPYSYTEKKRIRKNFAKRENVLDVPFLLLIASILGLAGLTLALARWVILRGGGNEKKGNRLAAAAVALVLFTLVPALAMSSR